MANLGADIRNSKLIASYRMLVDSVNTLNRQYLQTLKLYAFADDKAHFIQSIDVLKEEVKVLNEDIELLKNKLTILKGKAKSE